MQENRKSKRFDKIMDVIISKEPVKNGMQETLSTCKNISHQGIQLELATSYGEGELLYLRCFSNTREYSIDLMCEVIWVEKTAENLFTIGLKFLNLSSEDFTFLTSF